MILISILIPVVLSSAQLDTIFYHFGLMPHQISNRYKFHFPAANGSLSTKGIEIMLCLSSPFRNLGNFCTI